MSIIKPNGRPFGEDENLIIVEVGGLRVQINGADGPVDPPPTYIEIPGPKGPTRYPLMGPLPVMWAAGSRLIAALARECDSLQKRVAKLESAATTAEATPPTAEA